MKTREIKDLAIACEALSRIPGYDAENLRSRLTAVIDTLTKEMEEPPNQYRSPVRPSQMDEEIPF